MEKHTQQRQDMRPRYIGERDTGIPTETSPRMSAAYAHRREHDYTYGLSRESLRPAGPFEDDEPSMLKPRPVEKPKRKPAKKPKRRKHDVVRRIQPVLFPETPVQVDEPVDMPDDDNPDGMPWWLDADVITSRNEDMLSDLLADSY